MSAMVHLGPRSLLRAMECLEEGPGQVERGRLHAHEQQPVGSGGGGCCRVLGDSTGSCVGECGEGAGRAYAARRRVHASDGRHAGMAMQVQPDTAFPGRFAVVEAAMACSPWQDPAWPRPSLKSPLGHSVVATTRPASGSSGCGMW